jgi:hypothetical protein
MESLSTPELNRIHIQKIYKNYIYIYIFPMSPHVHIDFVVSFLLVMTEV